MPEQPDLHLNRRRLIFLLLLLPLFGQAFYYVKAVRPLWASSKIFPIASLPLALFVFRGIRPPFTRQLLFSLMWLLLVPSFTGIFSFQQNFFTGLTSQVKLLPLFYFFSFLGLMRWMKPTMREIETSVIILAALTLGSLILFWLTVPQSWYSAHYAVGDAPFFTTDGRGNRIRMPVYFSVVGILYCARKIYTSKRYLVWSALTAIGLAVMIGIEKARSTILALAATLAITGFRMARPALRVLMVALIPVGFGMMFSIPYLSTMFNTDQASGFDVRRISIQKAIDFLGTNPWHWLIGVGSISPLDPGGMITYFNHFFFLADITWLGVVFEFGILGAVLLLAIPVRGIFFSQTIPQLKQNAFLGSLQDYLIYVILISPLYPLTLSPGEMMLILAIFVYAKELQNPNRGHKLGA